MNNINSLQIKTINYSNMDVTSLCDNCDDYLEPINIRYRIINNNTGQIKNYCSKDCMCTDIIPTKSTRLYSTIFNSLISRQDDFGETFFPTIIVNPDEVNVN